MRAYIPAYELVQVKSLTEALQMIAREPGKWRPFAGGTDLMVLFEMGKLSHKHFVNLWNLEELRGITLSDDFIELGALTTYAQIQMHPVLQQEFPLLCQAARETGAPAIQHRGTIGGNIANASPAADTPPALIVYEAEIELVSEQGTRRVPYADFHTAYKKTLMREGELIKSVRLPRVFRGWKSYYRKVGTRRAQAISKVCFAGIARLQGHTIQDIRFAIGSVDPTVIRGCASIEALLKGQKVSASLVSAAQSELRKQIHPIDDIRSTSKFRVQVTLNLLEDFLLSLV